MAIEKQIYTSPLPQEAYIPDKLPHYDQFGRLIVDHALALKYDFSANLWGDMNKKMNERIDRNNCQVVVIAPHRDVNAHLLHTFSHQPIGEYPMATTIEKVFPEGGLDLRVKNEAMPNSAYLVASIYDEKDFGRVIKTADHYRTTLNCQYITLVNSYLSTARQDKNVDRDGNYRPNPIDIRANIKSLSGLIDRMIVIEPHSSAAQAYAAEVNIPFAPISTWEILLNAVVGQKIRFTQGLLETYTHVYKSNLVGISPDVGRNIANQRIREQIKIPEVSFTKKRIDDHTIIVGKLSQDKRKLLFGMTGLMFDDIGSTLLTAKDVAIAAHENGIKSIIMLLAHLELAGDWEENIALPFPSAIFTTDSHDPIGNYYRANNINFVSIAPLISDLIKADIEGVNFWTDPKWQRLILQSRPNKLEAKKK